MLGGGARDTGDTVVFLPPSPSVDTSMVKLKVNDKVLPIPYPPVDREGSSNHGFTDLRAHPELIDQIPELEGFSELRGFIEALNSSSGPFRSLGCEKSFAPFQQEEEPQLAVKLVSYVDLGFAEVTHNFDRKNFEELVDQLHEFSKGREFPKYLKIEHELTRTSYAGHNADAWSLTVWTAGFGNTEKTSRNHWAVGVRVWEEFVRSNLGTDLLRGGRGD